MVYAYDSHGSLPDTRTAAELFEERERLLAQWKAAYTQYVVTSMEAKMKMDDIDMEMRRRRWMEAPTERFSQPLGNNRMKPPPATVRPHVSETRPAHLERNGRMNLEGMHG